MNALMRTLPIAACIISLAACSAALVRSAAPQDDSAAKTFQPTAGRTLLYVYRASTLGGDYVSNVKVNGKAVAKGAYQRYNVLSVAPGHYKLEATALLYSDHHPLEIDADEGVIRFFEEVWQFTEGFSLHETTADTAKAALAKLNLAARIDVTSTAESP